MAKIKRTTYDLQNITHKTKDWATRILHTNENEVNTSATEGKEFLLH